MPRRHVGFPQEGESEESGGSEWEGKGGWELSEERLEKLRGRLATLRVLKFERSTEIVGLVVECQKLFRRLCPPVENPLQTKVQQPTFFVCAAEEGRVGCRPLHFHAYLQRYISF